MPHEGKGEEVNEWEGHRRGVREGVGSCDTWVKGQEWKCWGVHGRGDREGIG